MAGRTKLFRSTAFFKVPLRCENGQNDGDESTPSDWMDFHAVETTRLAVSHLIPFRNS
jgi:hypothetical protein